MLERFTMLSQLRKNRGWICKHLNLYGRFVREIYTSWLQEHLSVICQIIAIVSIYSPSCCYYLLLWQYDHYLGLQVTQQGDSSGSSHPYCKPHLSQGSMIKRDWSG
jgi:hypothetical protein